MTEIDDIFGGSIVEYMDRVATITQDVSDWPCHPLNTVMVGNKRSRYTIWQKMDAGPCSSKPG